jgi:hypothetical protein
MALTIKSPVSQVFDINTLAAGAFRLRQMRLAFLAAVTVSMFLAGVAMGATTDKNGVMAEDGEFYGTPPWPQQRVVLVLPLQLGASWNLDQEKAKPLLKPADAMFQQALQSTGKFSTTQLHRYNPIILRGIQEKIITREEADALLASPTLEGVQKLLAGMEFLQRPLIAQVTLDETNVAVGTPSATLTTTATGKLYEADNAQPIREVVVTSKTVPLYREEKRKGKTVLIRRSARQRILKASSDSFDKIAAEFVRPIEDITLPDPVITTDSGATVTVPPPQVIEVPAGQVLGTFEIPKK